MSASVELIAHRGANRERPENTVAAFERALALGADGVELDVHATADGTVVVHHDFAVRGAARPIAGMRDSELAGWRVGGEPIPTLDEVLELCAGRARVYVEIKGRGIEHLVVARLRERHDVEAAVHGFDHRAVRRVRDLAPGLRRGILLDSYLIDVGAAIRAADAQDLWQQWTWIDGPLVDAAAAAGARVVAWTINEGEAAGRLAALGVRSLCTDVLPQLAALRAEEGPRGGTRL